MVIPDVVGNALAARRSGYDEMQVIGENLARRKAGHALAGGDYKGGANALLKAGMLNDGLGIQRHGEKQQADDAAQRLEFFSRAAQTLRQIPDDGTQTHRRAALEKLGPTLEAMGVDPQVIDQLRGADLSDQSLDMFGGQLEQEKTRIIQSGRYTVGIGERTGEERWRHELPQDAASPKLPFGWSYDENGQPVVQDTFVEGKARLSAATRKPSGGGGSRARSGGGGSSGYRPAPSNINPGQVKWD